MIKLRQKNQATGRERVLFLNPMGADSAVWKMTEQAFAGFECCFCDYPGYLDNPYVPYDSFATLADELIGQLELLDDKPLHIVGFSFGSWLAQHVVHQSRALHIKSFVLIGSSEKIYTHGMEMMKSWLGLYRAAGIGEVIRQLALWSFYTKTFDIVPDLVDIYVKKTASLINDDMAIINQLIIGERFTMPLDMSAVNLPCLILRGAHDFLYPRFCSEVLNSRIRNSILVEIPEAAHAVVSEQPAAVLQAIKLFINQ